ncbi:ATPase synthesis protein 25, mitochondrial [Candida viswanathii]|uniref:ATPase synthesis protein 25 n=1 Tax=Candida viswanathii TaxID=5486 RepID=A0A367Y057_9ASCO|nr:ATPase synthesis protein 25, mitochondrial [Candida viswanathii]
MITRGRLLNRAIPRSRFLVGSRALNLVIRYMSQTPSTGQEKKADEASDLVDENIPWYLREENSPEMQALQKAKLPELPEGSPETLSEFVSLMGEEFGLTDIELFDLSTLPEAHPKSAATQSHDKYVIMGTGKSEKHLYKAAYELRQHIKHNHDHLPVVEGMVSSAISKTTRRRLAKRVSRGPPATHSTYGIGANTWVSCATGVDGITIHMLTRERRRELKLEELYSEEPDYEMDGYESTIDRDDIFFGIRRHFHTTTRNFNASKLKAVYDELVDNGNVKTLAKFKNNFDEIFTGESVEEYNRKVDFYKILNLLDTKLVPADQIESIFQDKYSSLLLAQQQGINWTEEITNDIIKYMEYLLDIGDYYTPIERLDKVSKFVADVTNFTGDSIQLFTNDKFNSLLWNLSLQSSYNQLDSRGIHEIIESKGVFNPIMGKVEQDIYITRSIRELIRKNSPDEQFPVYFREQMMYSYGQTGEWARYWRDFQSLIQGIGESKDRLHFWITTAIFLSKVNSRDALRTFFTKYWANPSGYSFVEDFEKNEKKFNSENEQEALKKIVLEIKQAHPTAPWLDDAVAFVANL